MRFEVEQILELDRGEPAIPPTDLKLRTRAGAYRPPCRFPSEQGEAQSETGSSQTAFTTKKLLKMLS